MPVPSASRRLSRFLIRQRTLPVVLLTLLITMVAGVFHAPATRAQEDKSVVWDSYDVTIDVLPAENDYGLPAGSYDVTERQVIDFEGGPFSGGFADIPLGR